MKLKYQLRGVGIGMIVTALLMGVATGKGIPLSDAEIRAKALELGMVEKDSLKLTDVAGVSSAEDGAMSEEGSSGTDGLSDAAASGGSDVPEGDISAGSDGSSEAGETSEESENGLEQTSSEEAEPASGEAEADPERGAFESEPAGDAVRVVIEYGATSDHISQMLEDAGLVEDAASFDSYLCNNGLSRSITAGTYDIMPGSSEEEIIRIITKGR